MHKTLTHYETIITYFETMINPILTDVLLTMKQEKKNMLQRKQLGMLMRRILFPLKTRLED